MKRIDSFRAWLFALFVFAFAFASVAAISGDVMARDVAAANGGGEKGRSSVTANPYIQAFAVPVSGLVPPNKPSQYNDEFAAQRPLLGGGPFVQLASKWTQWDPGDVMGTCAINPYIGMMILTGSGEKQWYGAFQPLPLPVQGQAVNYVLIARALNFNIPQGASNYTDQLFGMLLAENLVAEPETSNLYSVHSRIARIGTVAEGNTQAMEFAGYDSIGVLPDGEINAGWPMQYLRADVQSSVNAGVYNTTIRMLASADGIGYQRLAEYSALDHAIRHVALAQRVSGEINLETVFDFIRHMDTEDEIGMAARYQQLGSV